MIFLKMVLGLIGKLIGKLIIWVIRAILSAK